MKHGYIAILLLYSIIFNQNSYGQQPDCTPVASTEFSEGGIWSYGSFDPGSDPTPYQCVNGRIVSVWWNEFQTTRSFFTWNTFDEKLLTTGIADDNLNIILLVYVWGVGNDDGTIPYVAPPDFLFNPNSLNLPPVMLFTDPDLQHKLIDQNTGLQKYGPPYRDAAYQTQFEKMVRNVKRHLDTIRNDASNPDLQSVANKIKAVQVCTGSTGDPISYHAFVESQWDISSDEWQESLFQTYTRIYYNEFYPVNSQDTTIHLLYNPGTKIVGNDNLTWLLNTYQHNPWIKTAGFGHQYQSNVENEQFTDIFNDPLNTKKYGDFIRARDELGVQVTETGWWKAPDSLKDGTPDDRYPDVGRPHRNMFALLGYMLHFGIDISNQVNQQLKDSNYFDAFDFFNRYAAQKETDIPTSKNAFSALRDGLDAADMARFGRPDPLLLDNEDKPITSLSVVHTKPAVHDAMLARFDSVLNFNNGFFKNHGAVIEDSEAAIGSSDDNLRSTGINDVGWLILPGNYERYLHQINPDSTTFGYWNLKENEDATDHSTSTSMFGRFARAINADLATNSMYFDIDDAFLGSKPSGGYKVKITVWYYDNGTDNWQVRYDADDGFGNHTPNKLLKTFKKTGTNKWLPACFYISNGNFAYPKKSNLKGDFFIKNPSDASKPDDIFTLFEVEKDPTPEEIAGCDTVAGGASGFVESKSIDDNKSSTFKLLITPNPSSEKFSVSFSDKRNISEINIYSTDGKLVLQKKYNSQEVVVHKNELGNKSGIYYVKASSADHKQVVSGKIIIQ